MTLEEVAGELYGIAPGGFVAARDEWVKRARDEGDRKLASAIGKLRRPTVAAWAVNLLAREATDEVDALLRLGDALRDAQRKLSAEKLRTLTTQRQQVVNALTRRAAQLAADHDQPLSEAVQREVGQTLHTALADPEVADQVRTGTLTTATSYEGFGPAALMAVPTRRSTERETRSPGTTARGDSEESGAETTSGGRGGSGRQSARDTRDGGETSSPTDTSEDGAPDRTTKSRAARKKLDRPDPEAEARRELADALEALETAHTAYDSARTEVDRTATDLSAVEDRIAALREELSHAESERRFTAAANRTAKEALNKAQRHLDHVERWAAKIRDKLSPS